MAVPDYGVHSHMAAQSAAALHGRQQRPYSVAVPGFPQVGGPQNKHTNTHSDTHPHTPTDDTQAKPSHESWQRSALVCLRKFRSSFSLRAADLRYTGIALLWQAVSSFTSTLSIFSAKASRRRPATLAYVDTDMSLFTGGWDVAQLRLEQFTLLPRWGKNFWQTVDNRRGGREKVAVAIKEGGFIL